ncbi:tetratricopeptide repeat protein [Roseovarius autotrophicus]|uniref:tetratricopeptide repeat protein n=1 Tax=Roseovarius autotrophicus TaxID=2824121 RepID=UPI0019EE1C0A|nr:tetratricopeptide repeat protein [Roseovarius autotrophicus]MBE0453810.1 tetratricopeptide repeat protein [Roseovarius sp.]
MAARWAGLLSGILLLAGCFGAPPPQGPYAPGPVPGAEAVDPLMVGHRLMDAGEYELAQRAYSRAAAQQGLTGDVLAGLGSANLALGRLGTAEKLLRRAIETEDATPEFWNNLGVVLMEKGEYLEAEQMLRRAYALDNGESDAIRDNLRLALAKSEISVYDDAVEDVNQQYKVVRRGGGEYLLRTIP